MAKVYRVTVRYPRPGTRQQVKHGTKYMVSATWHSYQREMAAADRHGWNKSRAVFTVEVAPNAAFQDISASYQIEEG